MDKIRKLITRFLFFPSFVNRLSSFTFFVFFLSPLVFLPSSLVDASVPHLINYQGRLTDTSGKPLEGSYSITFRIYDAESAGNMLWEETHAGVVIQKGIFSVLLGSVTNLNLAFDKPYFLEIKVGTEVMSPRQRIAASAYAFMAENVISLPKGIITMWSGSIAAIPSGWALCDGTNGTPDLRDRFIAGARQDEGGVAKTNVTGTLSISGDGEIPAHSHGVGALTTASAGEHSHNLDYYVGSYDNDLPGRSEPGIRDSSINVRSFQLIANPAGTHAHTITGSTANTGSGTKNVAVYYTLAFIMKL